MIGQLSGHIARYDDHEPVKMPIMATGLFKVYVILIQGLKLKAIIKPAS